MKNYKFNINGNKYSVDVVNIEDNKAEVELNGKSYTVELDMPELKVPVAPKPVARPVAAAPVAAAPAAAPAAAASGEGTSVKSPLPGTILNVFAHPGDKVTSGQRILLLEAMKMENNINAPKDGTIKTIRVQQGDAVMEGDVLFVIE